MGYDDPTLISYLFSSQLKCEYKFYAHQISQQLEENRESWGNPDEIDAGPTGLIL